MYKTTVKDFNLFKNECTKWINKFNLNSWEIVFFHATHEPKPEWETWWNTEYHNRVANLGLAKT